MIKIVFIYFLLVLSLQGGIIDNYYLLKANKEIKKGNFENSLVFYQKVKNKTDEVYYNMGNLYYKLEQYDKALTSYQKVELDELQHSKYHNMANCYTKLLEYEKAIEFNKKALEYKDDQKTRYNLQLSQVIQKKILLENESKQKKNTLHKIGSSLVVDDAISFDSSEFKDDKLEERDDQKFTKNTNLSNSETVQESIIMVNENIEDEKKEVSNSSDSLEFNNYLQQKWDNKLNQIKTYTLLIPLEKGAVNDSKTPW